MEDKGIFLNRQKGEYKVIKDWRGVISLNS
jgi:hypothetical protein